MSELNMQSIIAHKRDKIVGDSYMYFMCVVLYQLLNAVRVLYEPITL